jgi:predicted nucleic acid-binding protein
MRLIVIDASILFSFFKPESFTRKLLKSIYLKGAKLIVPDFGLDELYSLKKKICRFCGIDTLGFMITFALLSEIIDVVPGSEFKKFESKALKLLPGHAKDMPYFALALSAGCGIWSNEKRFKEQPEVDIFSTADIKRLFDVK